MALYVSDIKNNCFERLKGLLKNKSFDINEALDDGSGSTALHVAVKNNQLEMTKFLLEHGADVNVIYERCSCLIWAIENDNFDLMKLLLLQKVDLNKTKSNNLWITMPLHYAAEVNNCVIVELLLLHKADPNVTDAIDRYPLFYAIENKNIFMTELLLNHGASLYMTGNRYYGSRKLMMGFWTPFVLSNAKVRKLFISHGADELYENQSGTTVLFHAVVDSEYEYVEYLLKKGLRANKMNKTGKEPLHYLSYFGDDSDETVAKVQLLVNHGAEVNTQCPLIDSDDNYCSLFAVVASRGHFKVADCMLNLGAIIDLPDRDSPFFAAISKRNIQAIEYLIAKGARLDVRKRWSCGCYSYSLIKYTIWTIMSEKILWEIVQLFIESGVRICNDDYRDLVEYPSKSIKLGAYQREFDMMKVTTICDSPKVTYSDLLVKRGNALASYLRNEKVYKIVGSNHYEKLFPLFSARFETNLSRGLERIKMLNDLAKIMYTILNAILPFEVVTMILMHFADEELKVSLTLCK